MTEWGSYVNRSYMIHEVHTKGQKKNMNVKKLEGM